MFVPISCPVTVALAITLAITGTVAVAVTIAAVVAIAIGMTIAVRVTVAIGIAVGQHGLRWAWAFFRFIVTIGVVIGIVTVLGGNPVVDSTDQLCFGLTQRTKCFLRNRAAGLTRFYNQ